ncbi:glycosyltransferase [Parvularcula sp. ZS-1/3]|uniref:Glycosyltransferase n=1 Tax=Parvularcula mediterranea TaxID=2732508 RepID=A0A7Y3W5R2_9PROT|nr:glycosyltransferase [Parvularcula mediterranea]NNU16763.1 glycosyltransferase [Parvularcula mediterranea]
MMDGKVVATFVSNRLRSDLEVLSFSNGLDGFEIPLPEQAFDGEPHRFQLSHNGSPFGAELEWKYDYVVRVTDWSDGRVEGVAFDPKGRDLGLTLALVTDLGQTSRQFTSESSETDGLAAAQFSFSVHPDVRAVRIGDQAAPISQRHLFEKPSLSGEIDHLREAYRLLDCEGNERGAEALAETLRTLRIKRGGTSRHPGEPFPRIKPTESISIIIPVYRGLAATEACIDSVLSFSPVGTRVILVNDASPEEEMAELLSRKSERDSVVLMTNETNLGFPGAVNVGIEAAGGDDVVVLNSDTEVAEGWLDAMRADANALGRFGSLTPLSNNATILSYPRGAGEFEFSADGIARLSAALAKIAAKPVKIPVGVGFCMLISREALNAVGWFSLEWGRGYGEEVDWCLRAADLGFFSYCSARAFVHHEGSVSFGDKERENLTRAAGKRIDALYPEFRESVELFQRKDPLGNVRHQLDQLRLREGQGRLVVHITHGLGGGTDKVIQDIESHPLSIGDCHLRLSPALRHDVYSPAWTDCILSSADGAYNDWWSAEDLVAMFAELSKERPFAVHIHSTVGWPLPLVSSIVSGLQSLASRRVATIHDQASFCPRVSMVPSGLGHCGEPSIETCEGCISDLSFRHPVDQDFLARFGVQGWREAHRSLIEASDLVVAPSNSAARLIQTHLGVDCVEVLPHLEEQKSYKVQWPKPSDKPLTLGVVGGINIEKGFANLLTLAKHARAERLPFRLVVIGHTMNDDLLRAADPSIVISGRYVQEDLGGLLKKYEIGLGLLPNMCPETYSFTLSELWRHGLPVAVSSLGALAERVGKFEGSGLIFGHESSAGEVFSVIREAVHEADGGSVSFEAGGDAAEPSVLYGTADSATSLFAGGKIEDTKTGVRWPWSKK